MNRRIHEIMERLARPRALLGILGFMVAVMGFGIAHTFTVGHQLKDQQCRNYEALRRVIVGTPTTSRTLLRDLGFSEASIDAIVASERVNRQHQLLILGPKPEGC